MDMATLGFRYITEYPDALKFHILPEYTYGGIRQPNRNPLLDRGMGVDGLRTGYLERSGYHFLFSATKDTQRLVGVVMGAKTAKIRDSDALKLLRYGFKNFSTVIVVQEGHRVGKVSVQRGSPPELGLSAAETLAVTIGKGIEESIQIRKEIPSSVKPPITKGAVLGKLIVEAEGLPTKQIDLIASGDAQARSYATYYLVALAAVAGLIGYRFWKRRRLREGRFPRRWS
jgi:D-alanyl-D-alanine carboxypeptidase (penicillin-binding protein 5/6)